MAAKQLLFSEQARQKVLLGILRHPVRLCRQLG